MVTQLCNRFHELKAQHLWTPLEHSKPKNEINLLRQQLKALQQKMQDDRSGGRGGGQGGGHGGRGGRGRGGARRDHSNLTCHRCGKKGHIAPNCDQPPSGGGQQRSPPNGGGNNGGSGDDWKNKAPAEGEPCTKVVDGTTFKWCTKCRQPCWRAGRNAHTADEHRDSANRGTGHAAMLSDDEETSGGRLIFAPGLFTLKAADPEPLSKIEDSVPTTCPILVDDCVPQEEIVVETVTSFDWDDEADVVPSNESFLVEETIDMFPGYLEEKVDQLKQASIEAISQEHQEQLERKAVTWYDCVTFDYDKTPEHPKE